MKQFKNTYFNISQTSKDIAVASAIAYCRNESCIKDTPEYTILINNPNIIVNGEIENVISTEKNLSQDVDICNIIDSFKRIYFSSLLNQVDAIRIYKGGVNLLLLKIGDNAIGQSAQIKIGALRYLITNLSYQEHCQKTGIEIRKAIRQININFACTCVLNICIIGTLTALILKK